MSEENPWKNGIYASDGNTGALFKIEGTKVSWLPTSYYDFPDEVTAVIEGTVAFGDFGPTRDEVKEASGGVETNNFEMKGSIHKPCGQKVDGFKKLVYKIDKLTYQKWFKYLQKWEKYVENYLSKVKISVTLCLKVVKNGRKASKIGVNLSQDGPDYTIFFQIGQVWPKMVKIDQK